MGGIKLFFSGISCCFEKLYTVENFLSGISFIVYDIRAVSKTSLFLPIVFFSAFATKPSSLFLKGQSAAGPLLCLEVRHVIQILHSKKI